MKSSECFVLTRTAIAIAERGGRHVSITVPEGATIEVMNGPFDGTRLMDVKYQGEMILMFTDDMQTHTEKIVGGQPEFFRSAGPPK